MWAGATTMALNSGKSPDNIHNQSMVSTIGQVRFSSGCEMMGTECESTNSKNLVRLFQ